MSMVGWAHTSHSPLLGNKLRDSTGSRHAILRIVRISNPHHSKYTMVDYAAMYGMKRVLAHVIDGLSDIEDETKITCPAEIIGIEPASASVTIAWHVQA